MADIDIKRLRSELAEVIAHYEQRGAVGHRAGKFIRRRGLALLALYDAVMAGPRVTITACNQIPGARDFDYGDMTHACGQFNVGDVVALVRTGYVDQQPDGLVPDCGSGE